MSRFPPEEARRIAALARLGLGEGEAERLAREMDAIAASFSDLASYADGLPEPEAPAAGALREDVVEPAPREAVDAILRAAPRVDARSNAVMTPRGSA